jgi:chitinase
MLFTQVSFAQRQLTVIGYYSGGAAQLDSFPVNKLTHIIFSFCHLKGDSLHVNNARDSATIKKLVSLKQQNPDLKIMLSLGGWGGCATCSDVFAQNKNRKQFAKSVASLSQYFGTDGIDLDWEYPAIPGFPGHHWQASDKENFTRLVNILRRKLGKKMEISFAAGGFKQYIDNAVDWKKIIKKVNRVNLMTYDLVNGFDTSTGHHTALYSTGHQKESTNSAVMQLINKGVPANKLTLGVAFYGRVWAAVADSNYGLYQTGQYRNNVEFKNFQTQLSTDSGFVYHWDEVAHAPYLYNPAQRLFVTFDDKKSIEIKTRYVIEHGLQGVMFWELAYDSYQDGLLDVIDNIKKNYQPPTSTRDKP